MELRLPELGEGVYEAEFLSWHVQVGDTVKNGQALMEVMTDKATMDVSASFSGTITELKVKPGQMLKIGEVVLSYTPSGKAEEPASPSKTSEPREQRPTPPSSRVPRFTDQIAVKAAPSVRRMARQMGIELADVKATGPHGRVLLEDLSAHLKQTSLPSTNGAQPQQRKPKLDFGRAGSTIKLQGIRGRIAEQMVRSKSTIPHYAYVEECDVTELVRMRASLRDRFAEEGLRLTYLPFFVKAATRALKEVPIVNALMDEDAQEIHLQDQYNVGIAVASTQGLIVPVIKKADELSIMELTRKINRLDDVAQTGKVKLEDLKGGTFTITSVGSIGGMFSTPVINHPEVAILGIGRIVRRPMFDERGNVVPADLVYLSLSFDHRVVDGAIGAEFTNALVRQLQQPASLLL